MVSLDSLLYNDLDNVLSSVEKDLGNKSEFGKFIRRMGNKGTPPKGLANVGRARAVLKDYISKGGISAITGEFVPFSDSTQF